MSIDRNMQICKAHNVFRLSFIALDNGDIDNVDNLFAATNDEDEDGEPDSLAYIINTSHTL